MEERGLNICRMKTEYIGGAMNIKTQITIYRARHAAKRVN